MSRALLLMTLSRTTEPLTPHFTESHSRAREPSKASSPCLVPDIVSHKT